jgi:hypothetical protein
MRALLSEPNVNLVTWRTVWRAHIEFGLMLRFDDIVRLTVQDLSFESKGESSFIRVNLHGGKTVMSQGKAKNERIITATHNDSCLYTLTKR